MAIVSDYVLVRQFLARFKRNRTSPSGLFCVRGLAAHDSQRHQCCDSKRQQVSDSVIEKLGRASRKRQICAAIEQADFLSADVTGINPNVMYEIGYEIEGLVRLFSKYKEQDFKGYVVESLWKFMLYTELAR